MESSSEPNGIMSIASPFSVEVTVSKLKAMIVKKSLQLFAEIDHRAGAEEAGLQMQPAYLLIFGHAKSGTPLMVVSPTLALDLPLKVLVWENADSKVLVSFNSPQFLAQRHQIPKELLKNISGVAESD